MELVGSILSRTFDNATHQTDPERYDLLGRNRPQTLHDLAVEFERVEAEENPDVVTPVNSLRLTAADELEIPRLGHFRFTDWSRRQCASLLGLRWNRWFENATADERAEEMDRRFARANGTVRIRTSRVTNGDGSHGLLRAFVSSSYAAIRDSMLARTLAAVLEPADPELRVIRVDMSDRSATYVIKVGEAFRPGGPGEVGEVWGGLLIRNSGVGFASLLISLNLTRLVCKNGMTAPLPDAILVRRRHRAIDEGRLRELLATQLERLPERLSRGAALLRDARDRHVDDVPAEIRSLLANAGMPMRHVPAILSAYGREPHSSVFGVVQAATLAAQALSPELRLELEQAAGTYLASM